MTSRAALDELASQMHHQIALLHEYTALLPAASQNSFCELVEALQATFEESSEMWQTLCEQNERLLDEHLTQEQRYRTILDHAPIVLFATDDQGICTLSEGKGLEARGLKPGQLVGHSLLERYSALPGGPDALRRALTGAEVTWEGWMGEQFLEIRLVPIRRADGTIEGVIGLSLDLTEHRRAEEQQRFFAEVGRALGQSINYETTLTNVAQLAVPFLADWCAVDIVGTENDLSTVVVAPGNPSNRSLASEILERYPTDPHRAAFFEEAVRSGEPILIPHISDEMLAEATADPTYLRLMREVAPISFLMVPLLARGQVLGALTLVMSSSGRHYTPREMALAQALAQRCALAVDNARLYREARDTERQLRLHATRLQGLADISHMLAESNLDLQSRLGLITRYISHLTDDICVIHLLNDEHLPRLAAFHYEHATARTLNILHLPLLAEELLGRVLKRGRPLLIPVLAEGWRQSLVPSELWPYNETVHIYSLLIVPLVVQTETIGALSLLRPTPNKPHMTEDQVSLQEFADRAALSLQNAQLYERVEEKRERLELLSRQLIGAQEQERRHIARELHDEVGQSLTAAKLNMEMLLRSDLPEKATPWVTESITILEQALEHVRSLSLELRPSLLDDLGLRSALRWYLTRQAERNSWTASLFVEPIAVPLAPEIETTCFRIVQEALTNAARHAQAHTITVALYLEEGTLHLMIDDDGVGFDVHVARTKASSGGSMGLLNMEERARLAGGNLDMFSQPGQGARIHARFPLPPGADQPNP